MFKLYGVFHNDGATLSPLLTKYDDQISVLSLYRSFDEATSAFKKVSSNWKDVTDCKVLECDNGLVERLREIETRLGARVLLQIS